MQGSIGTGGCPLKSNIDSRLFGFDEKATSSPRRTSKVTPSSKMVGDFAIFLVQNDLLVMRTDLPTSTAAVRERSSA